jgi:hypothetical protein
VRRFLSLLWCGTIAGTAAATPLSAQAPWDPEDRAYLTDLTRVTAIAVTHQVLYAATPHGLAVYDRPFARWRETLPWPDGPGTPFVTAAVADPSDDAVYLAGQSRWLLWRAFGRVWEAGVLPGQADLVVLDARDPGRGAYYRVGGRWYLVPRTGGAAFPATDTPPPGRRIGPLSAAELRQRAPAFDVARLRIERDELLRPWPVTAAAAAPVTGDLYVATDGNGVFRLDPQGYEVERLPAGVLGTVIGAVGERDGLVCAGSDDRLGTRRRGLTCMREDLREATYYERGPGLAELPGQSFRDIALDEGGVWAATDQGLLRVARRGGAVTQLRAADDLPSDDVRAVLTLGGGAWVGTVHGLAFVSDTGRRLEVDPSEVVVGVYALALRREVLWVASNAGALARPARPDSFGVVARLAVEGHPLADEVLAIGAGPRGLLLATRTRLVWVNDTAAHYLPPAPGTIGEVRAILPDGEGFWIAGRSGLALAHPERRAITPVLGRGDLPGPVTDATVSRDYLWIATERGLVRFRKRALAP